MAEENNGVQGQQGSAADSNDVTFTEEQQAHVNTMIADRLSRADKSNESKLQKALADARAKWDEEQKEAADIASMSDKQRQEHEQEKANEALTQAQAEADKLRAELNHTNMVNEASKMLADKGFTADEETLNFVVRDTAEDTTQAVTTFAKLVDDKVEAKRQEALHGKTPNNASASQGQGKSFGAQMAEKSNSRSLSGVADDFFGTKAKKKEDIRMKYTKTTADQINWLASTHLQSFTEAADAEYVSGAVFKKDNMAIGLVLNDVKGSTDDPMPAAVMVEGWVLEDRLPAALSADDKTALKAVGIKFRGDVPAAATAPSEG